MQTRPTLEQITSAAHLDVARPLLESVRPMAAAFHPRFVRNLEGPNVIRWTKEQLSDEQVQFLRDMRMKVPVGGFTLVHSTLDMPDKWGYVFDSLEADASFNYRSTTVCFHGHTHVPVVFEKQGRVVRHDFTKVKIAVGRKYFINVGSVGQPRDGDPRAAYAIFDTASREIELRRLEYDIEATQAKIRKAGLPERLAKRLEMGR